MPRPKLLKPGLPEPLERDVQKACVDALEALGCEVFRRNAGMLFGESESGRPWAVKLGRPGAADLFGALPDGRHFECEVKRPKERPRLDQIQFLRSMNARCPAFWVDAASDIDVIVPALLDGWRVVYAEGTEVYSVQYKLNGKRKTRREVGPTAAFSIKGD